MKFDEQIEAWSGALSEAGFAVERLARVDHLIDDASQRRFLAMRIDDFLSAYM